MKKLLSLLLVGLLTISMCLCVSAADTPEISMANGKFATGFTQGDGAAAKTEQAGTLGKAATDKVINITKEAAGGRLYSGTNDFECVDKDGNIKYNYFVLKFNYLPKCDRDMILRTANNKEVTPKVTADTFTKNRWNSVLIYVDYSTIEKDLVYTPDASVDKEMKTKVYPTGHIFVNGKEIGSGWTITRLIDRFGMYASATDAASIKDFRLDLSGTGSLDSDFDDIYIYRTQTKPEAVALTSFTAPAASDSLKLEGNIAKVGGGLSAVALASAYSDYSFLAYTDDAMSTELAADAVLADGNTLTITDSNGVISYYKVSSPKFDEIIIASNSYDETTNTLTGTDSVKFYADVAEGGVLAVAQYDKNGVAKQIKIATTVDNGAISVDFTPQDLGDSTVKAFLWNTVSAITPVCDVLKVKHQGEIDLLVIGNSFSADVTWWIRDIATADGAKFNVSRLDWGGKAINDHYIYRDVPLDQSKIYFVYNGVTQQNANGTYYWNLETLLENYEWDYIVMQNWGSTKDFYSYNESNYQSNWSNMVNLAEYIHEKEPNAELMVHETWSFESGYGDFTNEEIRDEIGADIKKLNERCAKEAAERIGQATPLRMLSSMDAFNAARAYKDENGVDIFNTTYYTQGHMFEAADRADIEVGDGSILLSPEDKAAGKISLHRDGYHASPAARYLIALNAYQTLTGRKVTGNTFATNALRLDSTAAGVDTDINMDQAVSGVVYQKYSPLSTDVIKALQTVVDGMVR